MWKRKRKDMTPANNKRDTKERQIESGAVDIREKVHELVTGIKELRELTGGSDSNAASK